MRVTNLFIDQVEVEGEEQLQGIRDFARGKKKSELQGTRVGSALSGIIP